LYQVVNQKNAQVEQIPEYIYLFCQFLSVFACEPARRTGDFHASGYPFLGDATRTEIYSLLFETLREG
jgi:hypothetical protein